MQLMKHFPRQNHKDNAIFFAVIRKKTLNSERLGVFCLSKITIETKIRLAKM